MQLTDERRTHIRLLCSELIEIAWSDTSGRQIRRIANLEDISASGFSFQIEKSIPAGTAVSMLCRMNTLTGMVRYCRSCEMGYLVGIELDKAYEWSVQLFRPKHLLNPSDLVSYANPLSCG